MNRAPRAIVISDADPQFSVVHTREDKLVIRCLGALTIISASLFFAAADPVSPDPNSPDPIEALDSVFIEELTWMEVRDAMKAGKTTILIPTGGVEQNGPYLATGKHNYILRATTESIARKLGNALVAPIVPFVPEGTIEPASLHMKYPGTISLTEETYRRLLVDICASFRGSTALRTSC